MQQNHYSLEMREVTKTYGQGDVEVVAVDNVDLGVREGEIVLIMGPSGSGKTTLLTMAGGLLRPTVGAVSIGDLFITDLADGELSQVRREKVGFVFQSFNLLASLSAVENVRVVLELAGKKGHQAEGRAKGLLSDFGMQDRLNFRPDQLSGGEKQRVSIARALANDPDLILADEPTANLDSGRGHEVMELLRRVAKERGKTVVIVSHDQRIRDIADRVLWLEDGKFKHSTAIIHDPVCGMEVDETRAAARLDYDGKTYYFCGLGCKRLFEENPVRFAVNITAQDSTRV